MHLIKRIFFFTKKLLTYFLIFTLIWSWNFSYIGFDSNKSTVMAVEIETFDINASGSWTAPLGVTEIVVECWGAGGGSLSDANRASSGGGGGGAYSNSTLTVVPENQYTYVVGAGGVGNQNGGDTYWVNISTVLAKGGGGTVDLTAGVGGNQANGVGSLKYSGGNGASGTNANNAPGGGGGGAAGSTGLGKNALGSAGGGATADNGGAGGNGAPTAGTGQNGYNYGGGGGGSSRSGGPSLSTSGANGFIRITYEIAEPIITVGSAGTQISEKSRGVTESYIGGAFTFIRDTGNANVTSITIAETGTIDANNNLSNLKLYYKTEATCSTSLPGDATAFNSTGVNFSSSSATATGTMSVSTSQVCVYITLNVSASANIGDTILIEISNPSTGVIVSAGVVEPNTAVAIPGTTTVKAAGNLTLDIVDQDDVSVTNPSFSFSGTMFSWENIQTTSNLGTSTQRIMITNTTVSNDWTLSISATGGESAVWNNGTDTYKYNGTASEGRLQVNPNTATIIPGTGCSTTGLTKQSAIYFEQGIVSTINIIVAGSSAETDCFWYIEDIGLTQDIPAQQAPGNYTIEMTLTVI